MQKNNRGTVVIIIKLLIILVLIVISGFLYSCSRENRGSEILIEDVGENSAGEGIDDNDSGRNESEGNRDRLYWRNVLHWICS